MTAIFQRPVATILVAAAFMVPWSGALAQSDDSSLEEIVVTARKIDESLQSVPVSVTAIDAKTAAELDIRSIVDVLTRVPGATVNFSTPSLQTYSLRGISSGSNSATGDAGVLVMIDNEIVSRDFMRSASQFDVERIEVLRGPQGTTYGRNSTGGVVHTLTQRPSNDRLFSASANLGNHNYQALELVANGGLSDTVAGRLSGRYAKRDGYSSDPRSGETLDDVDDIALRAQLLFTPSDALSILVRAHYNKMDLGNPAPRKPLAPQLPYDSPFAAYTDGIDDPWSVENSLGMFFDRKIHGAAVELEWELSNDLRLTSISTYRKGEDDTTRDLFGTPNALLDEDSQNDAKTLSQEIRLDNAAQDKRVTWLAGIFYLNEQHFRFEEKRIVFDTPAATSQTFTQDNETDSLGLFAEASIALNESTDLTVGGRYTNDQKQFTAFHTTNGPLGDIFIPDQADNPVQGTTKTDWSSPTYRVTLKHEFSDDVMVYGSYATGFKAGGFNPEPSNVEALQTPYDEENVGTLEVGIKSELMNRRLRVNASIFDSDFDDIQEEFFLPSGTLVTQNIASAQIRGVELEALLAVTEGLRVSLGYANYDHKYTNFEDSGGTDLSGESLQDVPDWTVNAAAVYTRELANDATLRARLDFRSRSDVKEDAETDFVFGIREGKNIWDARVAWISADERWEVALWGKNLGNEEEVTAITTQAFMTQRAGIYGPPRTYGLNVSFTL